MVLVVIDCGLFDFGCFCCFGFPVVGCDLGLVDSFGQGDVSLGLTLVCGLVV